MDKNTLAHTKWNCKYHIVFGGVKLLWSFWLTEINSKRFRLICHALFHIF